MTDKYGLLVTEINGLLKLINYSLDLETIHKAVMSDKEPTVSTEFLLNMFRTLLTTTSILTSITKRYKYE